jgi:acetyl-CoA carboxylase biotin carboxylase subunit
MEVNSRIQVEHPVSEQITRFDLIKMQIEVALGRRTLPQQETIEPRGHAIEARILAEDPARSFAPSPGKITRWVPPTGPGVRVDSAVMEGSVVPPFYDSMIAKLIVSADTREEAIDRLIKALSKFQVQGVATNIPLLTAIVSHDDFRNNRISTRWLETTLLPSFKA